MNEPRFGLILGFPRSGTTLLRQILDAHPDISCPPEPWLTTACARFLSETEVDGPAIGVRTGVGFSGIAKEELYAELRDLTLRLHVRMAGPRQICVEKSGFDIFHLETLMEVFGGHAQIIAMVRHPLDTIASNIELAARLGRYLPELDRYLAASDTPIAALAAAWADRMAALKARVDAADGAICLVRYEDLVSQPADTLAPVFAALGASALGDDQIGQALSGEMRVGLGDWKITGTHRLSSAPVGQWRKKLSRQAVARIHPVISPMADAFGYDLPRRITLPDRTGAMRQVELAARMAAQSVARDVSDN